MMNRAAARTLSPEARRHADVLLLRAWQEGLAHDRLEVLHLLPVASLPVMAEIVTSALESSSPDLREHACAHAIELSRQSVLPQAILDGLRHQLVRWWAMRGLRGRRELRHEVSRFGHLPDVRRAGLILRVLMNVDLACLTVLSATLIITGSASWLIAVLLAAAAHLGLWIRRRGLGRSLVTWAGKPRIVDWKEPLQDGSLIARALGRIMRLNVASLAAKLLLLDGPGPAWVTIPAVALALYAVAWADATLNLVISGDTSAWLAVAAAPIRWWLPRHCPFYHRGFRSNTVQVTVVAGFVFTEYLLLGGWAALRFFAEILAGSAGVILICVLPRIRSLVAPHRRFSAQLRRMQEASDPVDVNIVRQIMESASEWAWRPRQAAVAFHCRKGAYTPTSLKLLADILAAQQAGIKSIIRNITTNRVITPRHGPRMSTFRPDLAQHSPPGPPTRPTRLPVSCSSSTIQWL